jgi:hypothetical protein
MNIRLCDMCGKRLTQADLVPMIHEITQRRYSPDPQDNDSDSQITAVATVQIFNENNHPLTDICLGCKLKIVTDGNPFTFKTDRVATLHPQVAHDTPPAVRLFSPPPTPPSARMPLTPPKPPEPTPEPPPPVFVPSAPPPDASEF